MIIFPDIKYVIELKDYNFSAKEIAKYLIDQKSFVNYNATIQGNRFFVKQNINLNYKKFSPIISGTITKLNKKNNLILQFKSVNIKILVIIYILFMLLILFSRDCKCGVSDFLILLPLAIFLTNFEIESIKCFCIIKKFIQKIQSSSSGPGEPGNWYTGSGSSLNGSGS